MGSCALPKEPDGGGVAAWVGAAFEEAWVAVAFNEVAVVAVIAASVRSSDC